MEFFAGVEARGQVLSRDRFSAGGLMKLRFVFIAAIALILARPAGAQQRPLLTEDPEPIGAGRVLVEGGIDIAHNQQFPVSGLTGNLFRIPTIGISVGISSIAELQIDGGLYDILSITSRDRNAPLASLLTVTGTTTHDVSDILIGTKIRVLAETAEHPAFSFRFATKLPNASNEKGLGLDTTDFFATVLVAKTVQSVRVVGNLGLGILADPTNGNRQNDALMYGLSFARALTQQIEFVGELNGRLSTRAIAFPGTESRGLLKLGGRYTLGSLRMDTGVFFGLTTVDPTIGVTAGFTYVFNAFTLP
jgi:hypothetical protein